MKTCILAAMGLALLMVFCGKTQVTVQVQTGEDDKTLQRTPDPGRISEEAAISIAKDNAVRDYSLKLEDHKINAVLYGGEWRVVFDLKNRPPLVSGGVIEYRIDEKTGGVVGRTVYQ
jgi:hypothetical protein